MTSYFLDEDEEEIRTKEPYFYNSRNIKKKIKMIPKAMKSTKNSK